MGDEAKRDDIYISWSLTNFTPSVPLPAAVYLHVGQKFICYRNEGDALTDGDFDKFLMHHIQHLFIKETSRKLFEGWKVKQDKAEEQEALKNTTPDQAPIIQATLEVRRAMFDLFLYPKNDAVTAKALESSKKMVTEFMKKPFVVNNISQLQKYGRGCVDHSVNVSTLSVFLGLRMGYSSQTILHHIAVGGLLHDYGKVFVKSEKEVGKEKEVAEAAFTETDIKNHPILGKTALEGNQDISKEVLMIVAQHHEMLDGSGYPSGLKGLAIYDLARLMAITNIYDNLVSVAEGQTLPERINKALEKLEKDYHNKLEIQKLDKIVKIIKYSLS